jgi:hypothetical protein
MPSRAEIVSFDDSPPPQGADPWVVAGTGPGTGIEVTDPDPAWPRQYDGLAGRIREALGWRVLQLEHIGSTAVPGLAAKPIIDIDLAVADPARERDSVPPLEAIGFQLMVREPSLFIAEKLGVSQPACGERLKVLSQAGLIGGKKIKQWVFYQRNKDRIAEAKELLSGEW